MVGLVGRGGGTGRLEGVEGGEGTAFIDGEGGTHTAAAHTIFFGDILVAGLVPIVLRGAMLACSLKGNTCPVASMEKRGLCEGEERGGGGGAAEET